MTNVINLHYLQKLIGPINANFLLFYALGLIIVDKNPTMTKICEEIKFCYHDTLFRMLSSFNFAGNAFSKILITIIEKFRRPKVQGWLIIDDTSIVKKFAKNIGLAGFAWCGSVGRVANGIHFVTLLWTDGKRSFPVGFRIWVPKKDYKGNKRENYRTKIELAEELIVDNIDFCKNCQYLTFDSWYCSKKFLQSMKNLGIPCISSLQSNRKIIFKKREIKASDLAVGFNGIVELPLFGEIFIYAAKIGKSERYLLSTDTRLKFKQLRKRYKRRWPIEEFFRNIKQNLGLCDCQCRKNAAVINHIIAVFFAYVVLETMRFDYSVTHGKIKSMMRQKFYGNETKTLPLQVRKSTFLHAA